MVKIVPLFAILLIVMKVTTYVEQMVKGYVLAVGKTQETTASHVISSMCTVMFCSSLNLFTAVCEGCNPIGGECTAPYICT